MTVGDRGYVNGISSWVGHYSNQVFGLKAATDYTKSSAQYNTAVGYFSLNKLSDGSYNVAVGAKALYNLEDAYRHLSFGTYTSLSSDSLANTVSVGHEVVVYESDIVVFGSPTYPYKKFLVETPTGIVDLLLGGGISGGGSGFIPYEGAGITISSSGANYVFSVDDYISKAEVTNISGNLQTQIDSINVVAGNNVTVVEGPANTWTISASISGGVGNAGLQGRQACNATDVAYQITHPTIDSSVEFPVVSLDVPTSGSNLYVQGIYNRTNTSFWVVLSEVPTSSYGILWHINAKGEDGPVGPVGPAGADFNVASISGSLYQGIKECDTTNSVYSISHPPIDTSYSFPVLSLIVPTSGSNLFVQGITNRYPNSFDVILSEAPNTNGYYISWHLPTSNFAVANTPVLSYAITNIPFTTTTTSGSYQVALIDSVVYAEYDNTVILPASPTSGESHWIVNVYSSNITLDGNGKSIRSSGVTSGTVTLVPDQVIHVHFNSTKAKWYAI